MGAKTMPVQSFFGSNIDPAIDMATFSTPYLNHTIGSLSVGAGAVYPIGDGRLILGVTLPVKDSAQSGENENTSITASIENDWRDNSTITVLTGLNSSARGPLGMTGFGALNMNDDETMTQFIAVKSQSQLTKDIALTAVASTSNSSSSIPSSSLVGSTRNIRSSSLGVGATLANIFGNGALSMSLSQPDRVFSGDIHIDIPQLSDSEGNIAQQSKLISLSPSGRQLDFKIAYTDAISPEASIRLEYAVSRNINHLQGAGLVRAGFIGFNSGGLKVGAKLTDQWKLGRMEMRYGTRF